MQQSTQSCAQIGWDLVDVGDLALLVGDFELLDDLRADVAEIRLVENLLEFVEEVLVEFAAEREQPRQAGGEDFARLLECA